MIPKWMLTKILEFIMKEFGNRVTKYVDKPNELDTGFKDLEKKVTDIGFKTTASVDMIKRYSESVDNITDKIKSIEKAVTRFEDSIEKISKIAHPPAIPLKEINEFRETNKNVKWIMGIFKIMKKNPLLKSMFK
jgi:methyl-accepting chemotaxis protein